MNFARHFLETPLKRHVEWYAHSHQNKVNQALHFLGIPMLVIGWLGLLANLRFSAFNGPSWLQPNLGLAALLVGAAWYAWASPVAGLMLTPVGVLFYALDWNLPIYWSAAIIAGGIILHTIGHYGFEHKPPVFFSRPISTLEAPAWLLVRVLGVDLKPKKSPES